MKIQSVLISLSHYLSFSLSHSLTVAEQAQGAQLEKQAADPAPAAEAVLDVEKQLKKLQKKLKAIQDLKGKDPQALDADQKAKLAGEAEVLAEIEKLSAAAPVKAASPKVSPNSASARPKLN